MLNKPTLIAIFCMAAPAIAGDLPQVADCEKPFYSLDQYETDSELMLDLAVKAYKECLLHVVYSHEQSDVGSSVEVAGAERAIKQIDADLQTVWPQSAAMPAQAGSLCFSPVRKKNGDISSDRPWWKPFNYRVQVNDGPVVKPEAVSSTTYEFDGERPLVRIYLGNKVVESFHFEQDMLLSGRNCVYFNNLYETWSIAELWQVKKLCTCEAKTPDSNE